MAQSEVPLIPLEVLFGNPKKSSPKLSPDASKVAFLAPSVKEDVANVWVQPLDGPGEAVQVTQETHRDLPDSAHLAGWRWTACGKGMLYSQDAGGDENWHLYLKWLDDDKPAKDLTPFKGARVSDLQTSGKHPSKVIVSLYRRDPSAADACEIDLETGHITVLAENAGDLKVQKWKVDGDFVVRGAEATTPDLGTAILARDSPDGAWRQVYSVGREDSVVLLEFAADNKSVFLESSEGSDTTRLIRVEVDSGKVNEIAADDRGDLDEVLFDADHSQALAASFNFLRREWKFVAPEVEEDFKVLRATAEGDFSITSQSKDGQVWIVKYVRDNGPIAYYVYKRQSKAATLLFVDKPDLEKYTLSKREGVLITARDGRTIPAYLSLPVHGGPWWRDSYGFDSWAQLYTNRGYAVMQPNYRGSTGYGKAHLHAGDGGWGTHMQDDVTDAALWAVEQGIADRAKLAIAGESYGGYATLAGVTFTPEMYCCAFDNVGPSNVATMFESFPSYWEHSVKRKFVDRVGDCENDDALNRRVSPLFHLDKLRCPLGIAHGANDPRVAVRESEQLYAAMKEKGIDTIYLCFADEGHGCIRKPNKLFYVSHVENFFARYLGGRAEALRDPPGDNVTVKT